MWICSSCEGTRWVREVVSLEYIDGMDNVFLVEERVSEGQLKCVHCGSEEERMELRDDDK